MIEFTFLHKASRICHNLQSLANSWVHCMPLGMQEPKSYTEINRKNA